MRLQPAIALDEFVTAGFGDRESRQARREARRERRSQRKEARQEKRQDRKADRQERRGDRKVTRLQRKKARVKSKLARTTSASASASTATTMPSASTATREPTLQPAPMSYGPSSQQAMPMMPSGPTPWQDAAWDTMEEYVDDEFEPDFEEGDEFEEATEGIGAWRPFQKLKQAVAPRTAPRGGGSGGGMWGPSVRMGRTLRIQAAAGHRAAVIDLKPGLFLVAEIPEAVTKTEFGLAPILAPLMVTAARRALDEPPRQRRGPLASLFRRRDQPVRYVEVQPQGQTAPSAPLALPGPVDESMVVPAPNVGWADDATVAAAYGCDQCDRAKR